MRSLYLLPVVLGSVAYAHQAFWHKAMYCLEGGTGSNNLNTADIVQPLYQLPKSQWWFHASNNCDKYPPPEGTFLELPAGGSFAGEIANNRAFTSLAYNGQYAGDWTDGTAPNVIPPDGGCIVTPNLHTPSEAEAAGTAFAIAYVSDLADVTEENLVVFSVAYNTPWKRAVSYEVPAAMPACPEGGCICAWGWVPNHCGIPNMYMQGFKCKVTGATSTIPVGPGKPPTWCEGNSTACTKGPKQMIYFNQADGNNVDVSEGYQADGQQKSPNYNMKMGFVNGAQNDIFAGSPAAPAATTSSVHTTSVVQTTSTKAAAAKPSSSAPPSIVNVGAPPATTSKVPSTTTSKVQTTSSSTHIAVSSPAVTLSTKVVASSPPATSSKAPATSTSSESEAITTSESHSVKTQTRHGHWHHHTTSTSSTTSTLLASSSPAANVCSKHSKREAAKQILKRERHRKRIALDITA